MLGQRKGLPVILFFLFFFFVFMQSLFAGGGPGQPSFERAYRIEKKDPQLAVEYYKEALSLGLNRELRKAAKWRLFYLYKDLGRYKEAMRLAKELGASQKARSMKRSLVKEVEDRLKVDQKTAEFYIEAANLSSSGKRDSLSIPSLELALQKYPKHEKLIHVFVRASLRARNREDLIETFAQCPSMACQLAKARLMLEEDGAEAQEFLRKLSFMDSLTALQKTKILYLLARSYRENGKIDQAVDYYRLAANYAAGKRAAYYHALAAFALYEAGYKKQARALFGEEGHPESFHLNLLDLILRVDLDGEREAYEELRRLETKIRDKKRKGQSPRLMKAALQILAEGAPN